RQPDHPLHQVQVRLVWTAENDHVASLETRVARQPQLRPRDLRAVRRLAQHQEVAHEERVLHGAGRDRERLHQERPDQQEQAERDGDRLDPLHHPALRLVLLGAVHGATGLTRRPRPHPYLSHSRRLLGPHPQRRSAETSSLNNPLSMSDAYRASPASWTPHTYTGWPMSCSPRPISRPIRAKSQRPSSDRSAAVQAPRSPRTSNATTPPL